MCTRLTVQLIILTKVILQQYRKHIPKFGIPGRNYRNVTSMKIQRTESTENRKYREQKVQRTESKEK